MSISETAPLLWSNDPRDLRQFYRSRSQERLPYWRQDEPEDPIKHKDVSGNNPHAQFCALVGCPPSKTLKDQKFVLNKKSLYGRTQSQLRSQNIAYNFSASLSNTLLLSQVVLGAALTALGASASSHILITIFGAMNTIIAGLVAYLKSRGQPMRARMYRDDLERIVDEIENSEIMWRGISEGVHGYSDIDTEEVTVRSEVARLTRLYERAIRLNGMNNPDMYMAGAGGFDSSSGGAPRPSRGAIVPVQAVAPPAPQPSGENSGPVVPVVQQPEDVAPATKNVVKDGTKDSKTDASKANGKKPATDGASDDKVKPKDPANDAAKEQPAGAADPAASKKDEKSADPAPAPNPPPTTTPAAPPAAAPAPAPAQPSTAAPPEVQDPDASPATAARLKPKRAKSGSQSAGNGSEGKKVSGDDDEAS